MLRSAVLVIGACLGACNWAFGLKSTRLTEVDAPSGPDDDGDGLVDSSDPCPADVTDGKDGDSDGVDDICDPSPMMTGDSIAAFYSFGTVDDLWATVGGNGVWSFNNSALVQTLVDDGAVEHPAPLPNIEPTVEVVVDPMFGGDGSSVGAYVVAEPSNIALECRVVKMAGGDQLQMLIGGSLAGTAGPVTGSGPIRLYGGQLPDTDHTVRCRARRDVVGVFVDLDPAVSRALGRASFAKLGLRTVRASAAFQSVTVFTRQ